MMMVALSCRQFLIIASGLFLLCYVRMRNRHRESDALLARSLSKNPCVSVDSPRLAIATRLARVRRCLSSQPWIVIQELHVLINRCGVAEFEFIEFFRDHSHKIFLPITGYVYKAPRGSVLKAVPAPIDVDPDPDNDCVVVTLGIGGDTSTERDLAAHYPGRCHFFGADPTPSVSQSYRRFGTYYPVAIDDISRATQQVLVMATKDSDGQYTKQQFPTVGLASFLTQALANATIINFMLMDVEGAEYRLLPLLSRWGRNSSLPSDPSTPRNPGISICQIMVELHFPLHKYNQTHKRYQAMIHEFVMHSDFVPIRAILPRQQHYFLAVNAVEKRCMDQYIYYLRDPHADDSLTDPGPVPMGPSNETLYPVGQLFL